VKNPGNSVVRKPITVTPRTGLSVPHSAETAAEIAAIYLAHRALKRPGAILVVQPPPSASALAPELVEQAVAAALADAKRAGVGGAAATPFLLAAVERATGGKSLETNLALLEANAGLAADIAVAITVAISGH
jgi:pseudouridine-5'-phosphate glycosidase